MSKKSRRRNKKILGALLLGGLGLAAANRNKAPVSTKTTIMDNMPKDDMEFKETVVSTPKTIMDSMPARPKKNPLSKRIKKNTNKVYTIQDAKKGIPAEVGNTSSIFKGEDGYLRSGKDATPMTGGRFGTYKAAQEMKRGALPPQLRTPRGPVTYSPGNDGLSYFKKGGRVGCGKAKRGFGRAMKGKK
tara:strand:- start:74 stop:637 length:564 start_codon:yes stop_codon:yes gene_type:complete